MLIGVVLGVIMVALDSTIIAVANPRIQVDTHASLASIQWVSNAYMLAIAVSLITVGKIGDHIGHRRVFTIGMIGFGLTSGAIGVCGDAFNSIGVLIALRAVAGMFGAGLMPSALALMRENLPAEKLSSAFGVWGGAVGSATAAGPIIGGLLVSNINWEACFYINVLIGAIAVPLTLRYVRETVPSSAARSFDIPGIATLTVALFLIVWGLIKSSSYGWGSGKTIGALLLGLIVLLVFVWRESRAEVPLIPLSLFRSRSLSIGIVLMLMVMFALFGSMFYITFFFENVHGYSATMAGVHLLPLTAALIVAAPISGLVTRRIGTRPPMAIGFVLAAVGLYGLSRLSANAGSGSTIPWLIMIGFGVGLALIVIVDVIVAGAPIALAGVASGVQATAMQIGGVLGTAVMGSVVASRVGTLLPKHWAAAHLPAFTGASLAQAKAAIALGIAPVTAKTPALVARLIVGVTHQTFVGALSTAFLIAAIGVLVCAGLALLTRAEDIEPDEEVDEPSYQGAIADPATEAGAR
jgi:EmrB/QacA subfamily drug resistance transporter